MAVNLSALQVARHDLVDLLVEVLAESGLPIISLAEALNLTTIAEGVETALQAHGLVELGCVTGLSLRPAGRCDRIDAPSMSSPRGVDLVLRRRRRLAVRRRAPSSGVPARASLTL